MDLNPIPQSEPPEIASSGREALNPIPDPDMNFANGAYLYNWIQILDPPPFPYLENFSDPSFSVKSPLKEIQTISMKL